MKMLIFHGYLIIMYALLLLFFHEIKQCACKWPGVQKTGGNFPSFLLYFTPSFHPSPKIEIYIKLRTVRNYILWHHKAYKLISAANIGARTLVANSATDIASYVQNVAHKIPYRII